jgi:hypothetical protein
MKALTSAGETLLELWRKPQWSLLLIVTALGAAWMPAYTHS